jgi:hypothetical protein
MANEPLHGLDVWYYSVVTFYAKVASLNASNLSRLAQLMTDFSNKNKCIVGEGDAF